MSTDTSTKNKITSGTSGKRDLIKSAGVMGAGTFLSRILGLVREQVFAFLFGAGNATDAFNIAFRIPNLLRDLFAEGAMSAALVPTFTQEKELQGERRAWRLAGLVFRTLFLVVGALAALGIFFAPQLVSLYASAYQDIPGKFELTVQMTQIMFPFFPLVALAAAFMGILNACGRFFLPAFASALFNLTSILTGAALYFILPRYGIEPIQGMALGVVAGGAIQALCQWPALRRAGYRWQPRMKGEPLGFKDPALRRMLLLMVPGMIGLAATQINVLVNSILATSQGPGAVSWLNYAFRLMQFPIGIFGVSLAAATLPQVSKLWVRKEFGATRDTLHQSLLSAFAINLPASAGLAFLSVPIIRLLFQYGKFEGSDTLATAWALAAYAVGLTAYSAVKVLVPACYAMGNTRLPVLSSALTVGFTILLNLALIKPLGYAGLALGTSLGAIFNFSFLLVSVRSLLTGAGGNFPIQPLLRRLLMHTLGAAVMGVSVFYIQHWVFGDWANNASLIFRAFEVFILILLGTILTLLIAKLMRLSETTEACNFFVSKVKNRLSQKRT